jgi:factor associated with neutral sphingomyelinase activation
MFPFSKIRAIERLPESLASPSASNSKWRNNSLEGFQVKTSLLVKMKENGVDAPYVFEKEDSIWWFSLEFSRVQSVCLFFLGRQKDSLLPHTFVSPVDFFF